MPWQAFRIVAASRLMITRVDYQSNCDCPKQLIEQLPNGLQSAANSHATVTSPLTCRQPRLSSVSSPTYRRHRHVERISI